MYNCVWSSLSLFNGLLLHLVKHEPVSLKLKVYSELRLKLKDFNILACFPGWRCWYLI